MWPWPSDCAFGEISAFLVVWTLKKMAVFRVRGNSVIEAGVPESL